MLTLNESLGEDNTGNKALVSLVNRACFTYLPTALHTPCPVLYLANKCAITCNRKYCSIGLFPAQSLFKSINAKRFNWEWMRLWTLNAAIHVAICFQEKSVFILSAHIWVGDKYSTGVYSMAGMTQLSSLLLVLCCHEGTVYAFRFNTRLRCL